MKMSEFTLEQGLKGLGMKEKSSRSRQVQKLRNNLDLQRRRDVYIFLQYNNTVTEKNIFWTAVNFWNDFKSKHNMEPIFGSYLLAVLMYV